MRHKGDDSWIGDGVGFAVFIAAYGALYWSLFRFLDSNVYAHIASRTSTWPGWAEALSGLVVLALMIAGAGFAASLAIRAVDSLGGGTASMGVAVFGYTIVVAAVLALIVAVILFWIAFLALAAMFGVVALIGATTR